MATQITQLGADFMKASAIATKVAGEMGDDKRGIPNEKRENARSIFDFILLRALPGLSLSKGG